MLIVSCWSFAVHSKFFMGRSIVHIICICSFISTSLFWTMVQCMLTGVSHSKGSLGFSWATNDQKKISLSENSSFIYLVQFTTQITLVFLLTTWYTRRGLFKWRLGRAITHWCLLIGGTIATTCDQLLVGVIQNFFRHSIGIRTNSSSQYRRVSHILAKVHWYWLHLRENWFNHPCLLVVSPD